MNEDSVPADPVNLIDLISRLAEPPEPAPVSLAPQTAGWVVLAAVALAVLAWLLWRFYRHWHTNAYRRAALAELKACGNDPARIAEILRRTALAAWPRSRVASPTGEAWLKFLDRTGGNGGFQNGPGKALKAAPYRPGSSQPQPALGELAARWIRNHDSGAGAGP